MDVLEEAVPSIKTASGTTATSYYVLVNKADSQHQNFLQNKNRQKSINKQYNKHVVYLLIFDYYLLSIINSLKVLFLHSGSRR